MNCRWNPKASTKQDYYRKKGYPLQSFSMACSKELRVPKEWSKYHHDLVNEAVNPELFSEEELVNLAITLGLSDNEVKPRKYFHSCRPYHMNRYVYVFIPDDLMSKRIFRWFAYLCLTIFMNDDLMEAFSESEMRQVCSAFEMMDNEICEQFPKFPTLVQMKQSLKHKKVNEKIIPNVLNLLEFTNSVGKVLIEEGNFLQEDVRNYWRRLVMVVGLYVEGAKSESIQGVTTTMDEYLWRRVMSGAIILWMYGHEVMSEMLGKLDGSQISFIHELYGLTAIFCLIVNDIYSHEKEKIMGNRVMNTVRYKYENKECSDDFEAFEKSLRITNAIIKVMYRKIENAKHENPDSTTLAKERSARFSFMTNVRITMKQSGD